MNTMQIVLIAAAAYLLYSGGYLGSLFGSTPVATGTPTTGSGPGAATPQTQTNVQQANDTKGAMAAWFNTHLANQPCCSDGLMNVDQWGWTYKQVTGRDAPAPENYVNFAQAPRDTRYSLDQWWTMITAYKPGFSGPGYGGAHGLASAERGTYWERAMKRTIQ